MLFIVAQITRGLILDPQTQNPPLLVFWLPPLEAHPLLSRPNGAGMLWRYIPQLVSTPAGTSVICFVSHKFNVNRPPNKKAHLPEALKGWLFLNVLNVQRKKNVVGCGVSLRFSLPHQDRVRRTITDLSIVLKMQGSTQSKLLSKRWQNMKKPHVLGKFLTNEKNPHAWLSCKKPSILGIPTLSLTRAVS